MTSDPNYQEKRRAQRVAATGPLTFDHLHDNQNAVLRNISTNGLCCISRTLIPEMTQVALTIRLPALPHEREEHYTLQCIGAVVRCEPLSRTNSRPKWEIGIYFTELEPHADELLHRYIKSRL